MATIASIQKALRSDFLEEIKCAIALCLALTHISPNFCFSLSVNSSINISLYYNNANKRFEIISVGIVSLKWLHDILIEPFILSSFKPIEERTCEGL